MCAMGLYGEHVVARSIAVTGVQMQNNKLFSSAGLGAVPANDIDTQAGDARRPVSERDLLRYMGDLLLELEEMAAANRFEGLADLLGYAHRETQRNQRLRVDR